MNQAVTAVKSTLIEGGATQIAQSDLIYQQPDAQDVSHFESLLAPPPEAPSQPAANVAAVDGSGLNGLGDAILRGMERIRDARDTQVQKVHALMETQGAEPINFKDAVQLQFELVQLGLHTEITTKTADKTSQGVQTLFRNQ
jgi:hypothetical protein